MLEVELYLPHKKEWVKFSSIETPELYSDKIKVKMYKNFVYLHLGSDYFYKFDILEKNWDKVTFDVECNVDDFVVIGEDILMLTRKGKTIELYMITNSEVFRTSVVENPENHDVLYLIVDNLNLILITGSSDETQSKWNFYKTLLYYDYDSDNLQVKEQEFMLNLTAFFQKFQLISTTNTHHNRFHFLDKSGILCYNTFTSKVTRLENINFSYFGKVLSVPAQIS